MSAQVKIKSQASMDDLDTSMRRVAARLAKLAAAANTLSGAHTADLATGTAVLSRWVPSLKGIAESLRDTLDAITPSADASTEAVAAMVDAHLTLGSSERACAWAKELVSRGALDAVGASALARCAAAADDGEATATARAAVASLAEDGAPRDAIARARALLALGDDESVTAAKDGFAALNASKPAPPMALSPATDPTVGADWIALARELYAADGHVSYLDAVEYAALNCILFGLTDDGAGITGRSLEGETGQADDPAATPAAARALADVADTALFLDSEGVLVASQPMNASVGLLVGERSELRCLVSTQLPTRGWSCWKFEPRPRAAEQTASATATRRTGRRQRPAMQDAAAPATPAAEERLTFTFKVRVPKWAADAKVPPFVKIDGDRANVKRANGFLSFDVSTDRATKIEVTFSMSPAVIDRKSSVSWAREVAISYGPMLLTASARYNPDEDLGLPLRIVSKLEDLELVGDIRRRLPIIQAMILGGGGRPGRVLFTPISDVGGLTGGIGGAHAVTCDAFRTWHRWGR